MSLSAARRISRQTGLAVREARVVGSQHGYQHLIIALRGGQRAFAKVAALPDPGGTTLLAWPPAAAGPNPSGEQEAIPAEMGAAFAAEANGLRWLGEADAVPVPEVLAVTETALVISMIPPGHPTPSAAFGFGAGLARLHAAGAADFGAPWRGFIASLPLDNMPGETGWPHWYARRRLLPYLKMAVDAGALRPEDGRL
ncbi:MAG TPA: fructosamine kinase family protein, partial [Streptosporangiaceae bacterium]